MTTLNDIITDNLKGKIVYVYVYTANNPHNKDKKFSNYYISDKDMEINENYESTFDNLEITKIEIIVDSVQGYYVPYEGTHINLKFKIDNRPCSVSLHCEDLIELKENK